MFLCDVCNTARSPISVYMIFETKTVCRLNMFVIQPHVTVPRLCRVRVKQAHSFLRPGKCPVSVITSFPADGTVTVTVLRNVA
jgi:hypothetical protein